MPCVLIKRREKRISRHLLVNHRQIHGGDLRQRQSIQFAATNQERIRISDASRRDRRVKIGKNLEPRQAQIRLTSHHDIAPFR